MLFFFFLVNNYSLLQNLGEQTKIREAISLSAYKQTQMYSNKAEKKQRTQRPRMREKPTRKLNGLAWVWFTDWIIGIIARMVLSTPLTSQLIWVGLVEPRCVCVVTFKWYLSDFVRSIHFFRLSFACRSFFNKSCIDYYSVCLLSLVVISVCFGRAALNSLRLCRCPALVFQ